MFLRGNEILAVLGGATIICFLIGGIFVFVIRPQADISIESDDTTIKVSHQGGDALPWNELRVSVTMGRGSPTAFVDPASDNHPLGPDDNSLIDQDGDNIFSAGDVVSIQYTSSDNHFRLIESEYYHVVIKHWPTNTVIKYRDVLIEREI